MLLRPTTTGDPPAAAGHVAPPAASEGRGVPTDLRRGAAAGVIAALVLLEAVVLLRLASGALSLPEIVADGFLLLLPGAVSSAILDALQRAAKPLLYVGIALGVVVVGGLLGRVYAARPTWPRALAIVLGAWVAFGGILYALVGAGPFGARLNAGPVWHGGTLLGLFLLFATGLRWVFALLTRRARPTAEAEAEPSGARRELLRVAAGAGLAAVAAGVAWRLLPQPNATPEPSSAASGGVANAPPFDVPGLSPEVTPTADFYTVSKNFLDPSVDAGPWRLRVDGLVDRSLEVTYPQLMALPASEGSYTLMCISNEVGGDLVGNARWKGVKLRWLLEQAGVQPGVQDVVFTAADDYTDSVTLERALHPDTLLAWEMNGAPLNRTHGFPARLLIPGIYGMKNVKWLTRISLVNNDVKGYWQTRGWDDVAVYQTASRVDTPAARARIAPGALDVAGIAFAGDRGIQRVEVSADGGRTWLEAQLKPGLSAYTWQIWRARVDAQPGLRDVRVRAYDGTGRLQTPDQTPPFPAGSTGWHTVPVSVGA